MGEKDEFITKLHSSVASGDIGRIREAYQQLGEHEPEVASRLVGFALARADPSLRHKIILSLAVHQCQVAVGPLCELLRSDPSPDVRAMSAFALMGLGDLSPLSSLVAALDDESEKVVTTSSTAIVKITTREVVEQLYELLSRPSWRVRLYGAVALLDLGIRDKQILQTLLMLADTPEAVAHDRLVHESRLIEERYPLPDDTTQEQGVFRTVEELIWIARRVPGEGGPS